MIVTRKQLMETGIRLFKEYGYENVSVGMICKEYGVTRGSFYHHFDSKSQLLNYWWRDQVVETENRIDIHSDKSAYDKLKDYLMDWARMLEKLGPDLVKCLCVNGNEEEETANYTTLFMSTQLDHETIIIELINEAIEEGSLVTSSSAQQLNRTYSLATTGLCLSWSAGKNTINFMEEIENIFNVVYPRV